MPLRAEAGDIEERDPVNPCEPLNKEVTEEDMLESPPPPKTDVATPMIELDSKEDVGSVNENEENELNTEVILELVPSPRDVRLVSELTIRDKPGTEDCRLSGRERLSRLVTAVRAIEARLPLINSVAPATFLN
jgi:hypothetical protein